MKMRRILSLVSALMLSLVMFTACAESTQTPEDTSADAAQAQIDAEFEALSKINLQLPTDRKIKVACVGDSITHGTDDRTHPAYPSYLQDILGDGFEVGNFGVGGTTLMSSDNISAAYTKCEMYQPGLDFNPDVVIMMLGTNDSGAYAFKRFDEYYDSDYQALINTYKALPSNPKIIVATSPYLVGVEHKVNEIIVPHQRELFTKLEGVDGVVDIYTWSKDRHYLYTDGVHYSPEGYYSLAMEFARNIFGLGNGYNTYTVKAVPNAVVTLDKVVSGTIAYTYSAVAGEDGVAYCYGTAGEYNLTVRAEDYARYKAKVTLNESSEIPCELTAGDHNVALYRPVTASSDTHEKAVAQHVNDAGKGFDATLWQPKEADCEKAWLLFDLGETKEIHGISIESWFQAYASGYNVQVSEDGENFTTVATITDGKGNGYDEHFFDSARGRYVKVNFTKKGYMFNYEVYDLKLFSNDERTKSELELQIIAEEEALKQADTQTPEEKKPSALPWIIADVVILIAGAVIIVLLLKKKA